MVKRITSKPRRGGYHMPPKHPFLQREVQIEEVDSTLFSPDRRQQEVDSQYAVDRYLESHVFSGRLHNQDYRD